METHCRKRRRKRRSPEIGYAFKKNWPSIKDALVRGGREARGERWQSVSERYVAS
jgi:hypothetical protein